MEKNLNSEVTKLQCSSFKDKLNDIYEEISNSIKIKSCCNWYEVEKKSSQYFLSLEKSWACQNNLHKTCSKIQE